MATLAGEAAIRIVPSLAGFKSEAQRRLDAMTFKPLSVKIDPGFKEADAQMDEWRLRQRLNAVNVPVRADYKQFQKDLTQVEHIFKRNSVSRAIRLNIKVIGLDALPALAYAAGSAASGLDALGKSAFALPGLLGGVAASVGSLLIGLRGVSGAFKAYTADTGSAAQNAKTLAQDNRQLERSYRDYKGAVRDTIREIQDLNAENRRSSLNAADAVLSVQEAADKLREGGQRTLTELQRDQLSYLEAVDHLQEVQTKAKRTAEDTADANAKGIAGADKVIDALNQIAENTDKINVANVSKLDQALAKLSPNARKTVEAVHGLGDAFRKVVGNPGQDALFAGMDRDISNLAQKSLPALGVGVTRVSRGLNTDLKAITGSLGTGKNQSFLTRIFGTTEGGLTNFSKALDPIVTSVLRLSATGNSFPRLAAAADRVFNRFDKFTDKIANDGSLDRWIDQSYRGITSIGNAAINIGSIISSVGRAFDQASGHQGGLLKSLEDGTKKLSEFLKGGDGQFKLVQYFKQAKEFIDGISDAAHGFGPIFRELTDTARQWSGAVFTVVGALGQAAQFIDRNTGLVKALLLTYLTLRTVKPIIEGITGAWKKYDTVLQSAAKNTNLPGLQGAANGMNALHGRTALATASLTQMKTAAANLSPVTLSLGNQSKVTGDKMVAASKAAAAQSVVLGTATQATGEKMSAAAIRARAMERNIFNFVSPAKEATEATKNLGSATAGAAGPTQTLGANAGTAGSKIGTMFGFVKNLAGALAPLALATGVIAGVSFLINKLGEAHRIAAEQGEKQATALGHIADSLDRVTGAATGQTLADTQKALGKYSIPGVGDVNVNDVLKNRGVNSKDAILGASDPRQRALLDTQLGPQTDLLAKDLENGDVWKKNQAAFKKAGINTPHDLAVAITDEDSAEGKKLQNLVDHPPRSKSKGGRGGAGSGPQRVPNAYDIRESIKSSQALQTVYPLVQIAKGNSAAAQGNVAGVNQITGDISLNAVGNQDFGRYSPTQVQVDPVQNLGVVTLGRAPEKAQIDAWEGAGYTVKAPTVPGGLYEVTLSPDASKAELEGYAAGGLVRGRGGPTDDLNMVKVSNEEHITRAKAVKYYGVGLFDDLNNMRIPRRDSGGWFRKPPTPTPTPPPPAPPFVMPPAPTKQIPASVPNSQLPPGYGGVPNLSDPGLGTTPGANTPNVGFPGFFPGASAAPFKPPVATPQAPAVATGVGPWGTPKVGASGGSAWTPAPAPEEHGVSGGTVPGPGPGDLATPDNIAYSPSIGAGLPGAAGLTGLAPYGLPDGTNIGYGGKGFPDWVYALGAQFNVQASTYAGHQEGSGLNKGIDFSGSPDEMQAFAEYMSHVPGIEQVIWNNPKTGQKIGVADGKLVGPGTDQPNYYADDWKDHSNHVHIRTSSQVLTPDVMAAVQSGDPEALRRLGIDPSTFPGGGVGGVGKKKGPFNPWDPKNLQDFLGKEASSIGSSLLGIGTQFLSGITGIDFGSILGPGQRIANGILGLQGGPGGGTDLNDAADQGMSDYIDGSNGLSPQLQSILGGIGIGSGFDGPLGAKGKKGGNAYRGLIQQILGSVGPSVGITTKAGAKLWEDALVKQIDSESGGDPTSVNDHDSNGRGGTQTVKGLFNFLPTTFESYKVPGLGSGQIGDPVSQIAAAVNYTAKKWGIDPSTGGPNRIGHGVGFKSGGWPKNMAMLSNGEYRTSGAATRFYGPGLFDALNSMALPRGFRTGGFIQDPLHPDPFNGGGGFGGSGIRLPPLSGGGGGAPAPKVDLGSALGSYGKAAETPGGKQAGEIMPGVSDWYDRGGISRSEALDPLLKARTTKWHWFGNEGDDMRDHEGGGSGWGHASGGWPSDRPRGYAGGGWPFEIPQIGSGAAGASGQSPGPLPLAPPSPPTPDIGAAGTALAGAFTGSAPSTGGAPGPGATAPAPDPGVLPGVNDALANIGGVGGAGASGLGGAQPGAGPSAVADPRATLGAAPVSQEHNLPALSKGIKGAASTIGSLASMAASAAGNAFAPGAGSAAGAGIQAGAQMGGDIAAGAVNVLSSLLVGTATGGSTSSASGVPLLPQRQPTQTGVPVAQRIHNGDVHLTNLDEYKRTQETMDAQLAMPFISKY